jgi:hypothetical protein
MLQYPSGMIRANHTASAISLFPPPVPAVAESAAGAKPGFSPFPGATCENRASILTQNDIISFILPLFAETVKAFSRKRAKKTRKAKGIAGPSLSRTGRKDRGKKGLPNTVFFLFFWILFPFSKKQVDICRIK